MKLNVPMLIAVGLAVVMNVVVAAGPPIIRLAADQERFIARHCAACHGAERQEANIRLDDLAPVIDTVEAAERWQQVLAQLNSGDMPPDDAPQPSVADRTEFLAALSTTMMQARKALSDQQGRITLRRLNRREYANTLRDLLGVDADVADLPCDSDGGDFDTVGAGLFMTDAQFETYRAIATQAVETMFAAAGGEGAGFSLHVEPEKDANPQVQEQVAYWEEWRSDTEAMEKILMTALELPENAAYRGRVHGRGWESKPGRIVRELRVALKDGLIKGLPKPGEPGYREVRFRMHPEQYELSYQYLADYVRQPQHESGVGLTRHYGPMDVMIKAAEDWPPGRYMLRVRAGAVPGSSPERRFLSFGNPGPKPKYDPPDFRRFATRHVSGTVDEPQLIEVPVTLPAKAAGGRFLSREFTVREKQPDWGGGESAKAFAAHLLRHGAGPAPAVWIDWIELVGPIPSAAAACRSEILGAGVNAAAPPERARAILRTFTTRAFRGSAAADTYVDGLGAMFDRGLDSGMSFDQALVEPLAIILSSPSFLYLAESGREGVRQPLSDVELASRLSYFLWARPPDDLLLAAARNGRLRDPAEVARHVDRMLDDDRCDDFISGFAHQWLGMKRLDFFTFSASRFPTFDSPTKDAARQEVYATVRHLIRSNGSLKDLLSCDYVVVNALMAAHYGIDGVTGDEFRPVSVSPDSPRGGLMGMAAILAMGSDGEKASAIHRGAWVLRTLLFDSPPDPPANIPQIDRLKDRLVSTRDRITAHQQDPQCAQCHRRIDPIGFGMENFDAVGLWRTHDFYERVPGSPHVGRLEWKIDPSGSLYGGASFKDFFELRRIVADSARPFARGFTEALLQYALGRRIGFSDEPLVEEIVQQAGQGDYSVRRFIHLVVASEAFRSK